MKRTYFVLLIPILLTAMQIMSESDVVVEKKIIIATGTSLMPVEKKEGAILFHGVSPIGASPITAHGVSPLGTSSPRKSSQAGRVKRAVSAFDLQTIDESVDSSN